MSQNQPAMVKTILIVDDHRGFAEMLSLALSASGDLRCVGTASTAEEGVRLTKLLGPDIVIIDIQMPGQDGLAATRDIRKASPGTLVAVVSAHEEAKWGVMAAEAGAHAFIVKNGLLSDMVSALAQMCSMNVATDHSVAADRGGPDVTGGVAPVLTLRKPSGLTSGYRDRPSSTERDLHLSTHA